jgi:hypothetical protein
MWQKFIFITGRMGNFLWPLIKQFMVASAPIVEAAAKAAVQITVTKYADKIATNDEKHADAFGLVLNSLKRQGIEYGGEITKSLIDTAIAAAVKGLAPKQ